MSSVGEYTSRHRRLCLPQTLTCISLYSNMCARARVCVPVCARRVVLLHLIALGLFATRAHVWRCVRACVQACSAVQCNNSHGTRSALDSARDAMRCDAVVSLFIHLISNSFLRVRVRNGVRVVRCTAPHTGDTTHTHYTGAWARSVREECIFLVRPVAPARPVGYILYWIVNK